MPRVRLRPALVPSRLPSIELSAGDTKTLGRAAQADIVVDHPSLSRLHARLHVDADDVLSVDDLESTNGVLVNGVRYPESRLHEGDRVLFGSVEYVVISGAESLADVSFEREVTRVPVTPEAATHVDQLTLRALLDTSRELMACTDLPALLERVLDRLQTILKPDRAAILLVDAVTGALTPRAVRPRGAYTSVSQFASSTVVGEALEARRRHRRPLRRSHGVRQQLRG